MFRPPALTFTTRIAKAPPAKRQQAPGGDISIFHNDKDHGYSELDSCRHAARARNNTSGHYTPLPRAALRLPADRRIVISQTVGWPKN